MLISARAELERAWAAADGSLLKPSGEYRADLADVGRPRGAAPRDDRREVLGAALVFAAANGRTNTFDYLYSAGVDIDFRLYLNTTGLHLAIQFQKVDMVHLLAREAATTIKDDQYNSDAGGWATACANGASASEMIRTLVGAS